MLIGDAGDNVLTAGAGDDIVEGGLGDDTIDGGAGSDFWSFANAAGGVTVDLAAQTATGQGNDTIISIENVDGSAFDDVIVGDVNANILNGGDGNDTLSGNGVDTLDGGNGTDTLSYSTFGAAVTVDLDNNGAQTSSTGDTISNFENVTGTVFADTLFGDANANTITGGDGNDTLNGGDGNDILIGGEGDDFLVGGLGDDNLQGGNGY
jgi:Ca2+-binding RTX toxin-like protein